MSKTSFEDLRIDQIRLDGNTQPRVELDEFLIAEYKEAYLAGAVFPPLDVMFDGASYWLYDGFHRRWGAERAGLDSVPCRILQGTREDAQWASYQQNQTHGLRRSRADKENAIKRALRHPDGRGMSDANLARYLGVSDKTVAKFRAELEARSEIPNVETRTDTKGRAQPAKKAGRRERRADPAGFEQFKKDVAAAERRDKQRAAKQAPADTAVAPVAPVDADRLCPVCEVRDCVVGQDRCQKCLDEPDDDLVDVGDDQDSVVEATEAPRLSKTAIRQLHRFDRALLEQYRGLQCVNVPEGHPIASAINVAKEAYVAMHKAIEAERNQ